MKTIITHYKINGRLLKNCRVIFLTDLHLAPFSEILKKGAELSPDIIAVGGDLDNGFETGGYAERFLRSASELAPVYFVLGNHEFWSGDSLRAAEKYRHARFLNEAYSYLPEFGMYIGGIHPSFSEAFLDKFATLPGFHLLLCHYPHYYPKYIRKTEIELTLSGHAHGGQWNFFGRGVYAPGQGLFPKYTSGMYERRLIVSRGLGDRTGIPRINNPHEIAVIDLHPI